MITINCRRCPFFYKKTINPKYRHMTFRVMVICHYTNNVLKIVDDNGEEIMNPTVRQGVYARIVPDKGCLNIRDARDEGIMMWPDYIIDATGGEVKTKNWMEEVNY
jgi:hypothetical protein